MTCRPFKKSFAKNVILLAAMLAPAAAAFAQSPATQPASRPAAKPAVAVRVFPSEKILPKKEYPLIVSLGDPAKAMPHFALPLKKTCPNFFAAVIPSPGKDVDAIIPALLQVVRQYPIDTTRVYLAADKDHQKIAEALARKKPNWLAGLIIPPSTEKQPSMAHPYQPARNVPAEELFRHRAMDSLYAFNTLPNMELPWKKQERIIFFGDANTQRGGGDAGFITLIQKSLRANKATQSAEVIKKGFEGKNIEGLYVRFVDHVVRRKPTLVVLWTGTNDVWYATVKAGTKPERYRQLLDDMVTRLQKLGVSVVVVSPGLIGERRNEKNPQDKQLDAFAKIASDIATQRGAAFCDLRAACKDYLEFHNRRDFSFGSLTRDRVNFYDRGHRLLADAISQSIAQAVRDRKKPASQPAE